MCLRALNSTFSRLAFPKKYEKDENRPMDQGEWPHNLRIVGFSTATRLKKKGLALLDNPLIEKAKPKKHD